MTVDPLTYDFARERLANAGWTYTGDIQRLAEIVQEAIEEFEEDLLHQYEREQEQHHG